MGWKTRRHGTHRQRGKRFFVRPYPRYEALRKAILSQRHQDGERLVKQLVHSPIRDVRFDGNRISLTFDGVLLSNRVVIVPHERWVASWSTTENIVYIDDDVPVKYHQSLAVHETIEKYLKERYRLDPDAEGHEASEEIERRFFLRTRSAEEWDDYAKIVERIHRKELKE